MEYKVRHRTTYRYLQDVAQSWHMAHLQLRTTPYQEVLASHVALTPEAESRDLRDDYFGNPCEWFFFDTPHALLEVIAESQVKVSPPPTRDAEQSLSWEEVRAM